MQSVSNDLVKICETYLWWFDFLALSLFSFLPQLSQKLKFNLKVVKID